MSGRGPYVPESELGCRFCGPCIPQHQHRADCPYQIAPLLAEIRDLLKQQLEQLMKETHR